MNHTYPNFTLINGYKWSTPIAVGLRPRNSAQRSLQPARRAPLGFSAHGPASGMGRTHGLKITRKPCQN